MAWLKFLIGPIGKWVLLFGLITTWTMANRIDAARKAVARYESGVLTAQIALQNSRIEQAEKLRKEAEQRANATEVELAGLEKTKDALLKDLENGSCDLPDDIRERLRAIQ